MRFPILAALAAAPAHGYELKQHLEHVFGSAWPPVNIGQIYSTLGRLERDGLVASCVVAQGHRPDKKVYELTDDGRAELRAWVVSPPESARFSHEFFLKLLLARQPGACDGLDLAAMLRERRLGALQSLRDINDRVLAGNAGATESLLLEGAILHLQADLKWLDLFQQHISQEDSWN